jgi:type IV pilus assembly protein PilY1
MEMLNTKQNTRYMVLGVAVVFFGTNAYGSDLSIYQKGTTGQVTLVMMLDNSGSMGSGSLGEDFGLGSCKTTNDPSGTTPSYTRQLCSVSLSTLAGLSTANQGFVVRGCTAVPAAPAIATSYKCYSRMDRLKDGMFAALNSTSVANTVVMGVGTFANSDAGGILVPAAALGPVGSTQRLALETAIGKLTTPNATPTAPAFAEAAAYLLGTSTTTVPDQTIAVEIFRISTASAYSTCSALKVTDFTNNIQACSKWNSTSYPYSYPSYDGSYKSGAYTIYTENQTQKDPDSGFPLSVASSKSGNNYISPLPGSGTDATKRATCDGQGIYFLTDGEPNGPAGDPTSVMATALNNPSFSCTGTAPKYTLLSGTILNGAPTLSTVGTVNKPSWWNCIGSFAQQLLGNVSEVSNKLVPGNISIRGDGATNPLYQPSATVQGVPIQSALVGIGTVFTDLTKIDPKQACQLGMRTGGAGDGSCPVSGYPNTNGKTYGNGGFYNVFSPNDVTNSITTFINDLTNVTINPISTGAVSIPSDSLNPTGYENFAYLRSLTPNPGATTQLLWDGNLKRYNVTGGALKDSGNANFTLNADGTFNQDNSSTPPVATTTDLWNNTGSPDGGVTRAGGAYSQVALPSYTGTTYADGVRTIRPLWSNFSTTVTTGAETTPSVSCTAQANGTISWASCGNALMSVPKQASLNSLTDANVTTQFTTAPISYIPLLPRIELLNYLGYNVSTNATSIPALNAPASPNPYNVSGGIIHSLPVQLTYSGSLKSDGTLSTTRDESVLYGSMEGALHLVAAGMGITSSTNTYGVPAVTAGAEQFVFIPKEVLDQTGNAQALILKNTAGLTTQAPSVAQTANLPQTPFHGVDAQWIADSGYTVNRPSSPSGTSSIAANKMNVYGGMRMGGFSYYGLNLLDRANPKLLFRVAAPATTATTDPMYGKGFDRMGQTWSTPVLANVRYKGNITRVLLVGGGYDLCYESPTFALNTTSVITGCSNKTAAAGNAVYMIDATTGALIWSASGSAKPTGYPATAQFTSNANMVNSIPGRVTTLDRDADGLIDHVYFADLGGQVFRADFDNASQRILPSVTLDPSKFPVRVQRIANLANSTLANSPRFYQAPVVSINDQGTNTFIEVNIASGDRSTPLDVLPKENGGGDRSTSTVTNVTGKPANNVYGIIDRDFSKNLFTNAKSGAAVCSTSLGVGDSTGCLSTANITLSQLQQNPQNVTSGSLIGKFFPYNRLSSGGSVEGWYRSLSSNSGGADVASGGSATRTLGGLKVFEESIAITGNLLVPVYDPQGGSFAPVDPCLARVVGETSRQRFCLPYGACLNSDGTSNTTRETSTGYVNNTIATHPTLLGPGIQGIALGPNSSGGLTLVGNQSGAGAWTPSSKLIPFRWYEKQPNPALVK